MPRPKISKIASSAITRRGRSRSRNEAHTVESSQEAPKNQKNDLYDVNDLEGAVVSARRVRKSNGKAKALEFDEESHGAGQANRDSEVGTRQGHNINDSSKRIPSEDSLLGDIDLESSSPSIEVGRRDRTTTTVENSLLAIGNFKRRPREGSILGRGATRARSSSVESNLAEDNGLTSVGRKNSSVLVTGNYKRRQREPSVSGRNAGQTRESSMGLDMDIGTPVVGSALKIGNFKRRAREPSILGTAQKKQNQRVLYDDDDDNDFNPEDESTPLNLSKTRAITSPSGPSSSNSRKRKLSAVQVPQSQTRSSSESLRSDLYLGEDIVPASGGTNGEAAEEDEQADLRSPSPELRMPSIEARSVTPEPLSSTMAPPLSSSPMLPDSPIPPSVQTQPLQRPQSRGRRQLRGRTPLSLDQESPPSSPPSLTHSPNRSVRPAARTRTKKQPQPAATLSTAELQALLPRRRRRVRDEFEIPSSEEVDVSGLGSDEDELTHSTIRVGVPRRSVPPPTTKNKAASKPKPKPGAKVTYGTRRQTTSDKENEDYDPDDSLAPVRDNDESENSQELEKRVGRELKRAARKFAEVDKWEMEFEDITASSSSPKDAR
ncbi:hypothetical protein B0O99DRAFT_638069 [Bisporella sp. PMI_857]|nr:hypothetical protein B0O99DRAFT_638069 [Bisporella sp. PMI_857]